MHGSIFIVTFGIASDLSGAPDALCDYRMPGIKHEVRSCAQALPRLPYAIQPSSMGVAAESQLLWQSRRLETMNGPSDVSGERSLADLWDLLPHPGPFLREHYR